MTSIRIITRLEIYNWLALLTLLLLLLFRPFRSFLCLGPFL